MFALKDSSQHWAYEIIRKMSYLSQSLISLRVFPLSELIWKGITKISRFGLERYQMTHKEGVTESGTILA
jgi:hypothetical protein